MIRDYRRLRVFTEADGLVVETYQLIAEMPATERFGLQAQIRRAAVSVPTNIVEGTSRHAPGDYSRFFLIARGSAREVGYLLDLAARLKFLEPKRSSILARRYNGLQAGIRELLQTVTDV